MRLIYILPIQIIKDVRADAGRQNDLVHKVRRSSSEGDAVKIPPERVVRVSWTKEKALLRLLPQALMVRVDERDEPLAMVEGR